MKDARHHLKHLQKKVMKSVKKENQATDFESPKLTREEEMIHFKRPKTLQNKRKIA